VTPCGIHLGWGCNSRGITPDWAVLECVRIADLPQHMPQVRDEQTEVAVRPLQPALHERPEPGIFSQQFVEVAYYLFGQVYERAGFRSGGGDT
jgi:hypothetical protein